MTTRATRIEVPYKSTVSSIRPPSNVRIGKRFKHPSKKEAQENTLAAVQYFQNGAARTAHKRLVNGPAAANSHSSPYVNDCPFISIRAPKKSNCILPNGIFIKYAAPICPHSCKNAARTVTSATLLRSLKSSPKKKTNANG